MQKASFFRFEEFSPIKKEGNCPPSRKSGAGDESRTRDLNLGKVALYQLSYSRIACVGKGSKGIFGAGDESRTRDLNLGKVALYQLSYSRIACVGKGSKGIFGAGDESRTRDLNLGKVALYQLSYSRISSEECELYEATGFCQANDGIHVLLSEFPMRRTASNFKYPLSSELYCPKRRAPPTP